MIHISVCSLGYKLSFDNNIEHVREKLVNLEKKQFNMQRSPKVKSEMSPILKIFSRACSITLLSFILVRKNPQLFHLSA